ncbi:MAG: hypothetical protein WCO28_02260 [Bacteroidota bacterium]
MLNNKEAEELICKIDKGVKEGVKKALLKISMSENPFAATQQNGKMEWINLKVDKIK